MLTCQCDSCHLALAQCKPLRTGSTWQEVPWASHVIQDAVGLQVRKGDATPNQLTGCRRLPWVAGDQGTGWQWTACCYPVDSRASPGLRSLQLSFYRKTNPFPCATSFKIFQLCKNSYKNTKLFPCRTEKPSEQVN